MYEMFRDQTTRADVWRPLLEPQGESFTPKRRTLIGPVVADAKSLWTDALLFVCSKENIASSLIASEDMATIGVFGITGQCDLEVVDHQGNVGSGLS